MEKEIYLINLSEISVSTFNILRRNLSRNNIPLTVSGLEKFGLKNMYDFDKVSLILDHKALDEVLRAMEKQGINLKFNSKEFEKLDFSFVTVNKSLKQQVRNTLMRHNALVRCEEKSDEKKKETDRTRN